MEIVIYFLALCALLVLADWLYNEWKYSFWAARLKCYWLGHDYYNGKALNIKVRAKDGGQLYEYDLCQRCWEVSEYRKVIVIEKV